MKFSACNQFRGRIEALMPAFDRIEVAIALNAEDRLIASVSRRSSEALELRPGADIDVLFTANDVLVGTGTPVQIGASNVFCGRIAAISEYPACVEVMMSTRSGLTLHAQVAAAALHHLDLCLGAPVYFVVRSVQLLLATPVKAYRQERPAALCVPPRTRIHSS
ncbi:TOBE domain-containing protein [Plasticicumulans acidivorans]|uniref:Molybdopterin-binding protein n=1 Tax=Plasticicumulans acidivorans TaxID=886464 RepID=A0A317MX33_9GAMM|nr:TOBE domain-containing protein [Plasticicumulans acidivorans]PWV63078.1 molybdopterin-binding protein [Plasticicumulans acidivorans]